MELTTQSQSYVRKFICAIYYLLATKEKPKEEEEKGGNYYYIEQPKKLLKKKNPSFKFQKEVNQLQIFRSFYHGILKSQETI